MYSDNDYNCKYCNTPLWRSTYGMESFYGEGDALPPGAVTITVKKGFIFGEVKEFDLCANCQEFIAKKYKLNYDELKSVLNAYGYKSKLTGYGYVTRSKSWENAILDAYDLKDKYLPKLKKIWETKVEKVKKPVKNLNNRIIALLKKKGNKMPASDIDAHLKYKNVDKIKKYCEELYHKGKIGRTGNYRYFVLNGESNAKKLQEKSKKIDVKSELKKYKGMLEEGLITQEQYDAKSNKLLDL